MAGHNHMQLPCVVCGMEGEHAATLTDGFSENTVWLCPEHFVEIAGCSKLHVPFESIDEAIADMKSNLTDHDEGGSGAWGDPFNQR